MVRKRSLKWNKPDIARDWMGIKGASEVVIVIIVKEVGGFRSKRETADR